MKAYFKSTFLLPALMASFALVLAGTATAQTFRVLHTFTTFNQTYATNSDGRQPSAGLILSSNTLYGTAIWGGSGADGNVFAMNTDGTGFTALHSFSGPFSVVVTNSDGVFPQAPLIISGNTLYGTANGGGSSGWGTVFSVSTTGAAFTTLYSFTNGSDGASPLAGLVLSSNTLYGTAEFGGSGGDGGTVFAVNTDGTAFTVLHCFQTNSNGAYPDGSNPQAGLVLAGSTLYGTASAGGTPGGGTIFAISTDGTGFTNLHNFNGSDGQFPTAGLVLSGNTLYGTARYGGSSGNGTVFKINTDGTGFTTLHTFPASTGNGISLTNSEGIFPSGLLLSGNVLYGTASGGGSPGNGTVFAIDINGTGFKVLHSFSATSSSGVNSDGAIPLGGVILSGNTLYGTTSLGGMWGQGTLFSISLPVIRPRLAITRSGTNVVLTWPTQVAGFDYTGYVLQFTTNLGPAAVWTTNATAPRVVNGQYTVTNPISGAHEFYRLSQ